VSGRRDGSLANVSDQPQTGSAGTDGADEAAAPRACTVCRGTGVVLSNLGGSLSEKQCPWCEGSRVFLPEHDAQAAG
jgi:DnaJ-class molecular chaperone